MLLLRAPPLKKSFRVFPSAFVRSLSLLSSPNSASSPPSSSTLSAQQHSAPARVRKLLLGSHMALTRTAPRLRGTGGQVIVRFLRRKRKATGTVELVTLEDGQQRPKITWDSFTYSEILRLPVENVVFERAQSEVCTPDLALAAGA